MCQSILAGRQNEPVNLLAYTDILNMFSVSPWKLAWISFTTLPTYHTCITYLFEQLIGHYFIITYVSSELIQLETKRYKWPTPEREGESKSTRYIYHWKMLTHRRQLHHIRTTPENDVKHVQVRWQLRRDTINGKQRIMRRKESRTLHKAGPIVHCTES